MGWLTDWLLPDPKPGDGIRGRPVFWTDNVTPDARTKLDKLAGITPPVYVSCDGCGEGGYGRPCKCDPNAGRPLRWWES